MLQAWRRVGVITYAGYILGFSDDTPEKIRRDIRVIQRELPIDILELFVLNGRYLTLLVDRFITVRAASVRVENIEYDGGGLRVAGFSMTFGSIDNQRFCLTLRSDASNIVVLTSSGRSLTLGPRINPVDPSGRPDIYFVPERGDELSLTVSRSVLSWPTPIDFYVMVRTPWWKRYVYYRLVWKKRSGAKLAMLWRYEQDYFAGSGWTKLAMMWNFQTGLLRVDIHLQASLENGGPRP